MKAHIPGTSEHKLREAENKVVNHEKNLQKDENKLHKLEAKQEAKDEKNMQKEQNKLQKQYNKAAAAEDKVNRHWRALLQEPAAQAHWQQEYNPCLVNLRQRACFDSCFISACT